MTSQEFENLVARTVAAIAPRFQRHLRNVAFLVEVESSDPDLLGLYEGTPLTERIAGEGFGLPDLITIFQRPHERMARTPQRLPKLVEDTVWHEVGGHHGHCNRAIFIGSRQLHVPADGDRCWWKIGKRHGDGELPG